METPFEDIAKVHRWFGVECNNRSWDLLDADQLSAGQREQLVHMAHASMYHWSQIGNVANRARGESLVGYVYAALGLGEAAVRHASRCVELVEAHPEETEDWDLAFAYDCLARATAANAKDGEHALAQSLKDQARKFGDLISGPEEKEMFDQTHQGGQWHGLV